MLYAYLGGADIHHLEWIPSDGRIIRVDACRCKARADDLNRDDCHQICPDIETGFQHGL
jgi:hypothetical protein